jgi:hypothetical protein
MVASTLRAAAGHLAAAFRSRFKQSPVHIPDGTKLWPTLRALLTAFDNVDPPPSRQKAITPRLLRRLFQLSHRRQIRANEYDHAADIIIGAFFFAMRSCEYTLTPSPGRTKRVTLGSLIFRDLRKQIINQSDPSLLIRSEFITIVFADQKNGTKMDARTQRRTGDRVLCPILRWGRAVQRILRTIPDCSAQTPLCAFRSHGKVQLLTNNFSKLLLRHTCSFYGGYKAFGFHPHEIGNRSIRSGAAMALFLMDHSSAKIMILGRWSSDAFLVYIRPQVLEWTNSMSTDMIHFDSFLDVGRFDMVPKSDPRTRPAPRPFNGRAPIARFSKFYLHH